MQWSTKKDVPAGHDINVLDHTLWLFSNRVLYKPMDFDIGNGNEVFSSQ